MSINNTKRIPKPSNYSTDPTNDPPSQETLVSSDIIVDLDHANPNATDQNNVNKHGNEPHSDEEITEEDDNTFLSTAETFATPSNTINEASNADSDVDIAHRPAPEINVSPVDCDRNLDSAGDTSVDMHMSNQATIESQGDSQPSVSIDFVTENSENQKKIENNKTQKNSENQKTPKKTNPAPVAAFSRSYAQIASGSKGASQQGTLIMNTTSTFQNVLAKFERVFKWAKYLKSIKFEHQDVLEYAIKEKGMRGSLFGFDTQKVENVEEKYQEFVKIYTIEKFFKFYTNSHLINEFSRLKQSNIAEEDYIKFIMSHQDKQKIMMSFIIPPEVYRKYELDDHLSTIKDAFQKLIDVKLTNIETDLNDNDDINFIKKALIEAQNYLFISNETICLKSSLIPILKGQLQTKNEKLRNAFIDFVTSHLSVDIEQSTYKPRININKNDKEIQLIEITALETTPDYFVDATIKQALDLAQIEPTSFSVIKSDMTKRPNEELKNRYIYGYLEMEPGKQIPVIHQDNIVSKVITKCLHCINCGSREHTRYNCKQASCAICKKPSHVAKDCYFKRPKKNVTDDRHENPKQKQNQPPVIEVPSTEFTMVHGSSRSRQSKPPQNELSNLWKNPFHQLGLISKERDDDYENIQTTTPAINRKHQITPPPVNQVRKASKKKASVKPKKILQREKPAETKQESAKPGIKLNVFRSHPITPKSNQTLSNPTSTPASTPKSTPKSTPISTPILTKINTTKPSAPKPFVPKSIKLVIKDPHPSVTSKLAQTGSKEPTLSESSAEPDNDNDEEYDEEYENDGEYIYDAKDEYEDSEEYEEDEMLLGDEIPVHEKTELTPTNDDLSTLEADATRNKQTNQNSNE